MTRRELIRTLLLAGGGSAAALAAFRVAPRPSKALGYYLFTAEPDADLRRLADVAGFDPHSTVISSSKISNGGQDLTIRTSSGLADPAESAALTDFVSGLRRRQGRARIFLAIETGLEDDENAVIIEQDGVVQEVISADENYDRIEVAGPMGNTVFRLKNGVFTVEKASCRHKRCQQVGQHHRIICAPNRLVATLPRRTVDVFTG